MQANAPFSRGDATILEWTRGRGPGRSNGQSVRSLFADAVSSPFFSPPMSAKGPSKRSDGDASLPEGYPELLAQLQERIRSARFQAALAVNRELVLLYWRLGADILARQKAAGWGAGVIDRLSRDLRRAFPDRQGFSRRNLTYMRDFAEAWPEDDFLQQVAAKLPWGHHQVLLDRLKDPLRRGWYARAALQYGWSRSVLVHQLEARLFERQGQAVTNFERTLPSPQSDLAREALKDPYAFGFLELDPDLQERELERGLIAHLRDFLLELGKGFAFVGSQYPLEVAGQEYFLDLLFYHLRLRCFVVLELKVEEFKPEFAGKMNFYLSAVDEQLRHPSDQPSIGLILCKSRNQLVVEYALRGTAKPMGVAEYRLTSSLPQQLRDDLPTEDDLKKLTLPSS